MRALAGVLATLTLVLASTLTAAAATAGEIEITAPPTGAAQGGEIEITSSPVD